MFRPGSGFTEFWFDETGDTDNRTCAGGVSALAACTSPKVSGGFGSMFRLTQSPKSDAGTISVFYNGDQAHAGIDNVTFFSRDQIARRRGRRRHAAHATQRARLGVHVRRDAGLLARGPADPLHRRGARRLGDARLRALGTGNEGDNEITGIYVSDGDPTTKGVLGAKIPQPFSRNGRWRAFWTQQHGDNVTYELIAAPGGGSDDN